EVLVAEQGGEGRVGQAGGDELLVDGTGGRAEQGRGDEAGLDVPELVIGEGVERDRVVRQGRDGGREELGAGGRGVRPGGRNGRDGGERRIFGPRERRQHRAQAEDQGAQGVTLHRLLLLPSARRGPHRGPSGYSSAADFAGYDEKSGASARMPGAPCRTVSR